MASWSARLRKRLGGTQRYRSTWGGSSIVDGGMSVGPYEFVAWGWVIFCLIWLAAALGAKRTARRLPWSETALHTLILGLACYLVLARLPRLTLWRSRFVPASGWVGWAGCGLAMAGFAFTIWARFHLGRNWSGMVELKQGHTLVRSGPYALVRHPIYTGLSLALLGTALISGEWRCLIGTVLAFFEWKRKSLLEERLMVEQFGREYLDYRRQVKGLIPFVW
jgi:protein-S-isoprenylcysteine O-methyltransferase Ste14